MATSFSGGGSQSTWTTTDHREASGKQAVLGVARMFREELVVMRITTDPIGMQPTACIPFGHMADLELGSDVHLCQVWF
jgi:hypothetical protein